MWDAQNFAARTTNYIINETRTHIVHHFEEMPQVGGF